MRITHQYKSLFIAIFCLMIIVPGQLCRAEEEIDAFEEKVRQYLNDKEFLKLEKLAESLREEKSFFSNGEPRLGVFYTTLSNRSNLNNMTLQDKKARIRLIAEWDDTINNSVTAKILLADAYLALAWDYRGGGFSDSVTTEERKHYKESLAIAWQYLTEAEDIDNSDPHIYASKIWVALGLGMSKVYMYEAVNNTLLIFPGYIWTYQGMANALLPRWYGDEGELERFADWLAAMTKEDFGERMYAEMARRTLFLIGRKTFQKFDFDLTRVISGIEETLLLYPDHEYKLHQYAWLAAQEGSNELSKKLFARIEYNENLPKAGNFWGSRENFEYWRKVANGESPAHQNNAVVEAALKGDLEMLKEALEKGEDINAVNRYGNTALNIAINNLSFPIAEHLIKSGIDWNIENESGSDALYLAASKGFPSIMELLLEKNADITKRYYNDFTPIHLAASAGSLKAVKAIAEYDKETITFKTKYGEMPLHVAAREGYEDIAEYLLELDPALVNEPRIDKKTPLHIAALNGHTPVVHVLLDHGADVNLLDARNRTAVNLAYQSKDIQLVKLLKSEGGEEKETISKEDWQLAEKHYVKGNEYYNQGEWLEAKTELDKAIEINPNYAEAFATYSILETYGFNNAEKGLEYANRAIELKPSSHPPAYYVKGRALDALQRKEEAFDAYRRFIELDPENPWIKGLRSRYPELRESAAN